MRLLVHQLIRERRCGGISGRRQGTKPQAYQKVINRYIDNGGTFDFKQYTYLITCGFTMEALYRLPDWNQSECVAVHGYDCLPDEALIYRIPLNHILPGEDRMDKAYYVFL